MSMRSIRRALSMWLNCVRVERWGVAQIASGVLGVTLTLIYAAFWHTALVCRNRAIWPGQAIKQNFSRKASSLPKFQAQHSRFRGSHLVLGP